MFKTVTVSAALEEKVTNPEEKFDVSQGYIMVGGARIRDAHRMRVLSTAQVIAQSSNVGAIKIGMRLGEERLYKYIRAYGFGSPTGIELPGETRGLVKPVPKWSKTSIGAMSMGQEVGITAIQATSAISSIANDGVWNAPRIVAGVTPPNAGPQTITFRPVEQRRVVSTLTAVEMKKMMEGVVLFGTGRKALLDGYTSAGKTGTAQKADLRNGGYSGKYVASFIGFAPVNQPAVTVAVIIDSATGPHQGGQISAPVFQRVAQQVLEYMHVPHDAEVKNQLLARAQVKDAELDEASPDHLGEPLTLTEAAASSPSLPPPAPSPRLAPTTVAATQSVFVPAVHAAGPVTAPAPLAAPPQPGPDPASGVVVSVDHAVVPSFLGKSLRASIEEAQRAGLVLDAHGWGVAREQVPAPGSRIVPGGRVAVRFGR
jgi:cell division protein FtsI (penicillin-binding protein 3)